MLLFVADLMLPGLVVPPAGLPQVQKGDLCAIALVGNRYCVSQLRFWGKNLGGVGMTAPWHMGKGLKEKPDSSVRIRVGNGSELLVGCRHIWVKSICSCCSFSFLELKFFFYPLKLKIYIYLQQSYEGSTEFRYTPNPASWDNILHNHSTVTQTRELTLVQSY